MTLKEARTTVLDHQYLIGKYAYGKSIDELIIIPSEKIPQQIFYKLYKESLNALEALEPFHTYNLAVFCVLNKDKIDLTQTVISLSLDKVKEQIID